MQHPFWPLRLSPRDLSLLISSRSHTRHRRIPSEALVTATFLRQQPDKTLHQPISIPQRGERGVKFKEPGVGLHKKGLITHFTNRSKPRQLPVPLSSPRIGSEERCSNTERSPLLSSPPFSAKQHLYYEHRRSPNPQLPAQRS